MGRRRLTVRLDPRLCDALSVLSGVTNRSMNDLVSEAVAKLVAEDSRAASSDLEEITNKLRDYSDNDDGFGRAIERFAAAEAENADLLEERTLIK